MKDLKALAEELRSSIRQVAFRDLVRTCTLLFGSPRHGGSHYVFRMPWAGDPRINLQPGKNGRAKIYQVRQVIAAIEKLEANYHEHT